MTGNWDFKFPKPDGTVSTLSSANSRRTSNIKPTNFNAFDYQPKNVVNPMMEVKKKKNKLIKNYNEIRNRNASQN